MENNSNSPRDTGGRVRTPTGGQRPQGQAQRQGQRPQGQTQRQAQAQRPQGQSQRPQGQGQRPQGQGQRPQGQGQRPQGNRPQSQRPQGQGPVRENDNILSNGFNGQQAQQTVPSKPKVNKLFIILGVIALLILVGLSVLFVKFKKEVDAQRNVIIKEMDNIKEMELAYKDGIMPFMLECIAYSKVMTSDYNSVLDAIDSFDTSAKTYADYKELKKVVDSFINYSKTIEGLADTAGYKTKLNNLNFYSENIKVSLDNYNKLVSSYVIFKNNFKYKFIGSNTEFSNIEE